MKSFGNKLKSIRESKGMTQTELSKLTSIQQSAISAYENDKYMPSIDALRAICNELNISVADLDDRFAELDKRYTGKQSQDEAVPMKKGALRPIPIISVAQAADYEPALEPLCDYLREVTDETALFVDVKDNYFALRVDGDSMSPDYPHGSVALVAAGEFPQRGDIVVAKLNDGQVVIKEYHRKDNVITLESINPNGKNFQWHCKENPGYVQWIWPVLEVCLKLRDQRWAKAKNGK